MLSRTLQDSQQIQVNESIPRTEQSMNPHSPNSQWCLQHQGRRRFEVSKGQRPEALGWAGNAPLTPAPSIALLGCHHWKRELLTQLSKTAEGNTIHRPLLPGKAERKNKKCCSLPLLPPCLILYVLSFWSAPLMKS